MEEKKALRQLPEIQNIAEYLRGMEFRKKFFGGVDAESVLEHFSAVTLQYEAVISAFMRQAEDYARRLAEAQALLEDRQAQARQPVQPQQPYAPRNPWEQAYNPWARQPAPQAYNPWGQQAAPQAYAPQAPAYPWQGGAEGLPDPAFLYG
ncbi:MAG: hypothetical protein LBB75_00890 [Oscillospiraceae bacterium]|jgi:hypothetical protein|nr:hypothetical protein [Oscillospiraceae bacterium]